MGTEPLSYWFDSQLRRYTSQFCRVFQNFQYQVIRNGQAELRPVPVKFGMTSGQVASILTKNSTNVMQTVPVISCYVQDVRINRARTQAPYHVDKKQIVERQYDESMGMYTTEDGNRYQLDRIMPIPLDLHLKADVWVSNQLQKDQLFEQMVSLFNPAIDLQHSDNPYDWNALTLLELEDIVWSSRQIPVGSVDDIEMFSLMFKAEVWIQPPSWLHPQKIIQQIILNITDNEDILSGQLDGAYATNWSPTDLLARIVVSPGNHRLKVDGDILTLLGPEGEETDDQGEVYDWEKLLELYGKYRHNISQIRLKSDFNLDNEDTDIIGTFAFHPTEKNKLIWYIDGMSIPANTKDPIDGALDPKVTFPGKGMPIPTGSTRYLILDDISSTPSSPWGDLVAHKNDIIQYDIQNNRWSIVFDSQNEHNNEFLINNKTGKQLRWDGEHWIINIEGEYTVGSWRIFL